MLFNSLEFLVFFPVVTILYFLLRHRYRWIVLLIASCYFYMAFIPYFILILGGTIIIDYFAGIAIENARTPKHRKYFLVLSLFANIGVLALFKYYNFFIDNVNAAFSYAGLEASLPLLSIVLPIGLSFHTFQAMSYTIEVYYGRFKAERNFGLYALYVLFYPQLVAGPIERPQNVLPQFHQEHFFSYSNLTMGLKLMIWGFFKKLVIADRLAQYVNATYGAPEESSGISLLITTYLFAFQIYCDFSGYTDIARGAARVMGFELMKNFENPYRAGSVKEFWSRWHISLSTWFRDYVYIPLGGNRVTYWKWIRNIFIVFLLSGFWHGANWTFIVWGALHGVYLLIGIVAGRLAVKRTARKIALETSNGITLVTGVDSSEGLGKKSEGSNPIIRFLKIAFTFHLVTFAWIFFRADDLSDAFLILRRIGASIVDVTASSISEALVALGGSRLVYSVVLLILFLLSDIFITSLLKRDEAEVLKEEYTGQKVRDYLIFSLLVALIILFGFFGEVSFIYFQF